MSYFFLFLIPVIGLAGNQFLMWRRLHTLRSSLQAVRRQIVAERSTVPQRPVKRNREVMQLGRDIEDGKVGMDGGLGG